MWPTDIFLRDWETFGISFFMAHIFTKSGWTYILLCFIHVFFYTLFLQFEVRKKIRMICIFAVILICLSPSDHAVDEMSVGRANKSKIYILYFILFENYWNLTIIQKSSLPSNKIENLLYNMRQEIQKKCAEVYVGHKMFAQVSHVSCHMSCDRCQV